MSGLGNLFGGFSAENNDALKYSAPKEPKNKAPKPAAVSANTSGQASPVPSPAATAAAAPAAAKTPGPSKIMASASIRLYKVNPSTGGYDAVENGGLLGCVMMGTGLTFQILVYNAQKAPQASVAVGAAFDYTVRDLYMSFSDSTGNQWSVLFDSVEVATTFIRTVAATVAHVAAYGAGGDSPVRRSLPRTQPTDGDETVLSQGMSAGIYLTAWEMQEVADYPGDILAGVTTKRIQAPDEVLKVKLSAGEELIGGLNDALLGLKKGDKCLIGIPPQVFYRGASDGPIDATRRAFPGSWLLLEVEVAKMKSAESKSKKEKSVRREEEAPPAPAAVPESPAQRLAKRNNSASFDDAQHAQGGAGGSEVAARMAKLSGGGGHLAGIMNPNVQSRSRDYDQDDRQQSQPRHHAQSSPPQHRQEPRQDQRQDQRQEQRQYQQEPQHQQQQQQQQRYDAPAQQQYVETRLAVVEGQGVRSFFTDAGEEDPGYYQNSGSRGNNQHQQAPAHQQPAAYLPPHRAPQYDPAAQQTASGINQLHQSVAAVQQSMLQLHTKLDQVGSQVASSAMLQQQQQQALVAAGHGAAGAMAPGMGYGQAGMMGMGMQNGGMMGMNAFMNPMQQQQQQQQMQYQQMLQQQQLSMGTAGSLGTSSGVPSAMRIKTEDLVSSLQALLAEHERLGSSRSGGDAASAAKEAEAKEAAKALRSTIEKLEEKNDSLQARYDKLMTEKAELMEKYMEQFQTGSAATNKLYQLQQEVETLRSASASTSGASKEREQEQKALVAELQHKVMALQMESMEQKQALESSRASGDSASLLKQQLESARAESDKLRATVAALEEQKTALSATATRAEEECSRLQTQCAQESRLRTEEAAQYERRLAEAQASSAAGASSAAEMEALRTQLTAAEGTISALNLALESVANKSVEAGEQSQAEIAALQQQLAEANTALAAAVAAAAAASNSNSGASGKADAEELKAIMQDVYMKACEVFQSDAPDSAELQYAAPDVVKKIRGVLKKVTTERSTA